MNRRTFQFAWLLSCIFSCALAVSAPAAGQFDSPFVVKSWSNEEGLPQSSVTSVIQTHEGYLWLGTLNGLVRFDGIHFKIFDENNTPGLPSSRIVYLFEDSRTNLWVGTESAGIVLIKNGKTQNFPATQRGSNGRLLHAYEDSNGTVWFYMADGHCTYYQDGKMQGDPTLFSPVLFMRATGQLVPSRSGGNWILQNGRVQKWAGNQMQSDLAPIPWSANTPVTSACEDSDGNLIVGTLGEGIFWFDADGKFQHISKEEGLSSDFVFSLCMDKQGNLWAGTDGGGLDRIKRKIFTAPSGLHSFTAQSISGDERGGLWTAFNAHGVSYWITNSTQDFDVGRNLAARVGVVFVDDKQRVWAGTWDQGLFQFQTNHFVPAAGAEILGQQISALFEDRAGQLWAGTQDGLANFDGQKWKLFTTRDGLTENYVRAIAQDADGNYWIGTEDGGLNFFKDGKFSSIQKSASGLPGNDITCLYAGKSGGLWVGTYDHGLARLQDGKWTRFSTTNGLVSDCISYIIEDDETNLWVGSNLGLMRISRQSLDDFVTGKINSISCRTYAESDGLPTRECSSGSQPAAILATDGKLFFPTTKGVVSVNAAKIKPNLQPPTVLIESVLVDGHEQKTNLLDSAWSQSITIPPGYEQLEIDYTALNFSAPELVRFKCWLEGHEAKPTDVGSERVARYPKLPPGNYRFHVFAANEDGIWNETGSVLAITVQPFFWQTNWFRAAIVILILGIVAAIVRFISTQKLRREVQLHKQQEALERERARIARDLHDQLGANLTQVALLGEMAEADKNSPEEIESHARQISETARETTHSLDEIVWAINPSNDTLEGLTNYACKYAQEYLALANVRYRVDLPTQLPVISIPPPVRHNAFLAFKEAVNNVVKHAQASEVWIRLRLQPEHFILEVEDNGRGIAESDSEKNRNGLRNMKKRMEDIGGNFEIHRAKEKGTIVKLTVPIK